MTPDEAAAKLRASRHWTETLERAKRRLEAGFGKKPKGTPMAGGEVRIHLMVLDPGIMPGVTKYVRAHVTVHDPAQKHGDGSKFIFGQIFLYPPCTDGLYKEVRLLKSQMLHGDDSWWADPLRADIRATVDEARCEELTRAMWAAVREALPAVAGKQRTHAETVARARFKKAVERAEKDGMSRDDMFDVIDTALVKGIMER